MRKNKNFINFISNYWTISYLWCFSIFGTIFCITFIMFNLPVWSVIIMAILTLSLICVGVIMLVFSRCQINYDGIKIKGIFKSEIFLHWDDIDSVNIVCSKAYMRYHKAYIIEFNNSKKIKTNSDIALAIDEFSKNCVIFHSIYTKSLENAEQAY